MHALASIVLEDYRADPTLRNVVEVVGFGVEAEPPHPTQRVLRGQSDAVRETDRLLVWGGNIWDWLDP
jgi:hypothetical protein